MPSKVRNREREVARQPAIRKELVSLFVTGPTINNITRPAASLQKPLFPEAYPCAVSYNDMVMDLDR
jgi:hypothetical protein